MADTGSKKGCNMVIGSKDEILAALGVAVKGERLRQNITQSTLALRSGVSVNAVKHLETGGGGTLGTFVLVCRTLGKDGWIKSFTATDREMSPIEYVESLGKTNHKERKRARQRRSQCAQPFQPRQ